MENTAKQDREWEKIQDQSKVQALILAKFKNVPLYLKNMTPRSEFRFLSHTERGMLTQFPSDIKPNEVFSLYATEARHMEFDCKMTKFLAAGKALVLPLQIRIAKVSRTHPRTAVKGGDLIATNFRFDKDDNVQEMSRANIMHQVIFQEFERKLASQYPGIKIYSVSERDRPPETRLVEGGAAGILVENVFKPELYGAKNPEFLDYKSVLEKEGHFEQTKERYVRDHINSIICFPLVNRTPQGRTRTIAFMHYEAKNNKKADLSDYRNLKQVEPQITARVRDASTLSFNKKQPVLNVSLGGVAVSITDENLKKQMVIRSNVVFDLLFRREGSLTLSGRPSYAKHIGSNFVVGIDLSVKDPKVNKKVEEYLTNIISDIKAGPLEEKEEVEEGLEI